MSVCLSVNVFPCDGICKNPMLAHFLNFKLLYFLYLCKWPKKWSTKGSAIELSKLQQSGDSRIVQ